MKRIFRSIGLPLALLATLFTPAWAADGPAGAVTAMDAAPILAPHGRLRVAINLGNGVLAQRNPSTGELEGVSVVLARELAASLELPLELLPYPAAGRVFADVERDVWDVAFMALEPERAERIRFSRPYVHIDGTYLVSADSPYREVADLDREGIVISVGLGAAYDLYLSRTLGRATLSRASTSPAAIEQFLAGDSDAAAGVRQALTDAARGRTDVRVLDDRFMLIEQAMAIPRERDAAGIAYVDRFLVGMMERGRVRAALDESGQDSAIVPPLDARSD